MRRITWPEVDVRVDGPLSGIRVLDLSAWAVGPWAAALLASMGADVLKIDPPNGDPIRQVRPCKSGEPTTYSVSNLGKRNIVLDLKSDEGHAAALQLAALADVALENSRPSAMKRLGLDFPSLSKVNPKIVYASSSSFGTEGPMAGVGSTDTHGQAFSGFVSLNGEEGADPQFLRYSALVDLSTSAYLVQAVLLGVHWRNRNDAGCHVTTSQFEGALSIQATRASEYLLADAEPIPLGSSSATIAPSAAFQCRDKRWLAASAPTTDQWRAFAAALGLSELADDPRYATTRDRLRNRHDLEAVLGETFATKDLAWWRMQLTAHDVPHAEFAVLDDIVGRTSEQPVAGYVTRVEHPRGGSFSVGRTPWTFSRTPARYDRPPIPGEHQVDFVPDIAAPAAPARPNGAAAIAAGLEAR